MKRDKSKNKMKEQQEIIKAYKLLKSKGLIISKKEELEPPISISPKLGDDYCYHVIHDMSIDKNDGVLIYIGNEPLKANEKHINLTVKFPTESVEIKEISEGVESIKTMKLNWG